MYKRILSIVLCIVMLFTVLAVLTACDEHDDGCGRQLTDEEKLAEAIKKVNGLIEDCCLKSVAVTYEQLKTALASFYYVQENYSGVKLREIDGVTYRAPHFILDWENKDNIDKENTMYIITPLPKNEIGVYMGIKVTNCFVTDTAAKIEEMNKKLCQLLVSTTNKFQIDEMAERFRQFKEEYGGKVLCVDPINGDIRCPDYILNIYQYHDGEFYFMRESFVVFWQSRPLIKNAEGFITGIEVVPFPHEVPDDYTAKAGEIVAIWKKILTGDYVYRNYCRDRLIPEEAFIWVTTDNTKKP